MEIQSSDKWHENMVYTKDSQRTQKDASQCNVCKEAFYMGESIYCSAYKRFNANNATKKCKRFKTVK